MPDHKARLVPHVTLAKRSLRGAWWQVESCRRPSRTVADSRRRTIGAKLTDAVGEAGLDLAPAQRVVGIALGQAPYRVQMIGQDDNRQGLERVFGHCFGVDGAQQGEIIDQREILTGREHHRLAAQGSVEDRRLVLAVQEEHPRGPAPVSPVRTFRPVPNSRDKRSIRTMSRIERLRSIDAPTPFRCQSHLPRITRR